MRDNKSIFKGSDKAYPDLELPRWMKKPVFLEEELDL